MGICARNRRGGTGRRPSQIRWQSQRTDSRPAGGPDANGRSFEMRNRFLIAIILLLPVTLAAQTPAYKAPRTVNGQPDLQGIWDFRTITPMERPKELGTKAFFTAEEAAKYEQDENRKQNR